MNVQIRFEIWKNTTGTNYIKGVQRCDSCETDIHPIDSAFLIESWSKTYGYREGLVCSPECYRNARPLRVGQPYLVDILIVSEIPRGTVRRLPQVMERGKPSDLIHASSFVSSSQVNYKGRWARDPDQSKSDEKPIIPGKMAEGPGLLDLRDAQENGTLPPIEADAAQIDLILNAKPIEPDNQIEEDIKKRLENHQEELGDVQVAKVKRG